MISDFSIFAPYSNRLIQGFTTKAMGSLAGDDPNYDSQLDKLEQSVGLRPNFAIQIHSDQVLKIDQAPQVRPQADGFMTNQKGLAIGVKTADCLGVILFDPVQNAIAAVHSGWRGAAQDIVAKSVRKMESEFKSKPSDLLAAIGPSIGPCCLEFSDPKKELPESMHPFVSDHYVNLWGYTVNRLTEAGVRDIELKAECTKCNPNRYFSHRNGDTGRMAVFIGLL